jgi:hypothetical protein
MQRPCQLRGLTLQQRAESLRANRNYFIVGYVMRTSSSRNCYVARPSQLRWAEGRRAIAVLAAGGSILLHLAAFAPLILGGAASSRRASPLPIGAVENVQQDSGALSAFFVNEDASGSNSVAQEDVPEEKFLRGPVLPEVLALLTQPAISIEGAVAQDENASNQSAQSEAAGDAQGRALLFGRYLGQISARISRAWVRPRASIDGGAFGCRARISQDHRGKIQEVELQGCTADARWQLSLVHAIESASPLPAPPDPGVFTPTVTLEFESAVYSPQADPDLFEP